MIARKHYPISINGAWWHKRTYAIVSTDYITVTWFFAKQLNFLRGIFEYFLNRTSDFMGSSTDGLSLQDIYNDEVAT